MVWCGMEEFSQTEGPMCGERRSEGSKAMGGLFIVGVGNFVSLEIKVQFEVEMSVSCIDLQVIHLLLRCFKESPLSFVGHLI